MQDDSTDGDGAASAITGQEHTNLPEIQGDVSSTPEELSAKIDAELGIPHVPTKAAEVSDDVSGNGSTDEEAGNNARESENDSNTEETGDQEESTEAEATRDTVAGTPSDEELFIEVEDADGVTHKISKIEDLPEDFVAKNNRQGYEILSQLSKLDAKIEAREATRIEAEAVAEQTRVQTEQFDAWDREIEELGKAKRVDVKDQDAINKVFETIAEINTARAKANNPNMLTSFEDGLEKYEAKLAREAATDKAKQENERAKAKAGLIGGNSSTSNTAQPYRSGQYRSIDEIPV